MTNQHMNTRFEDNRPRTNWRYRVGICMFCAPFFMFVVATVIVPVLGLSAVQTSAVAGALVVLGHVVWFASIPLLGKEGFKSMKSKAFRLLKPKEGPIGKTRHMTGLILLIASILGEVLLKLLVLLAFFLVGTNDPGVLVVGVIFQQQAVLYVMLEIATMVGLVISFYVLGADFMDRLKNAFQWPGAVEA